MLRHPQMVVQDRTPGVDVERLAKVELGKIVFLLLEVYGTQAVPGGEVAVVYAYDVSETRDSLIEIIVGYVLVSGERVGVGEGFV